MDKAIQTLNAELIQKGACLVGFSDVSKLESAKGFPFCITIGYKLNDYILKGIADAPTYEYFHHYRTVNTALDQLALYTATYLERLQYSSYMIPASQSSITDPFCGAFSHKIGAVLCGGGFIGKSGLFISKQFGSKIRLATVFTNYPINVENSPLQDACGSCSACVDACPANAIVGNNYIYGEARDTVFLAEKCSKHMKANFQHIGRGSVCGICIKVCPYNNL